MTGFPSGIVRPLGFATKPDAGEPSRGPVEVDAFALHPRSAGCFFVNKRTSPGWIFARHPRTRSRAMIRTVPNLAEPE